MRSYEDLEVWQLARTLAAAVYRDTQEYPDVERYGLVVQMRRAAVSVLSNIAEGSGRATPGEHRQLISLATGSVQELDCQYLISGDLGMLAREIVEERRSRTTSIRRMLYRLHRSLG